MAMVNTRTKSDKIFDLINTAFMIAVVFVVMYPLWFVIISSFSDPDAVNSGRVIFWIVDPTIEGYQKIFKNDSIWTGYLNSIVYSSGGTIIALILTIPFAYAISVKRFVLRGPLTAMMIIIWYFEGGLIPTYLVVRGLGLINTRLAVMLIGSFGVWNVIIARTFFSNSIPNDLWEASILDGCDHFVYFFRIVLPLSKAIIAVISLFVAVANWNDFFKNLIYITDNSKFSLQLVLRSILIQAQSVNLTEQDVETVAEQQRVAGLIRYGVIIVSTLPMLIIYPFLQKYFVKGILVGSVKG